MIIVKHNCFIRFQFNQITINNKKKKKYVYIKPYEGKKYYVLVVTRCRFSHNYETTRLTLFDNNIMCSKQ